MNPLRILKAGPEDIPELKDLINNAYRGDSAKKGWTNENGIIEGDRMDEAEVRRMIESTGGTLFKTVDANTTITGETNPPGPKATITGETNPPRPKATITGETNPPSPKATITGCVYLEILGDELYLGTLAVSPNHQAGGIGKRLLQFAEQYALANNCHTISITVVSGRHDLITWYQRHGYGLTGEAKPFPTDSRFGTPLKPIELLELKKPLVS